MTERGRSSRLDALAERLGVPPDKLATMTPKEKAQLFREATAGTGNRNSYPSGKRDGEKTKGRHGMRAGNARRRA